MRKIWSYLSQYIKEDFSVVYYSCIAGLLFFLVSANYWFDFEDNLLESLTGMRKFAVYFLFYGVGYYCSLALLLLSTSQLTFFRSRTFWMYSAFGLSLLSLDSSMPYLSEIIYSNTPSSVSYWFYKVAVNGISFFTVLLPLYIFYRINDRSERNFYGINQQHTDLRPYWYLLLLMLPLLLSASLLESFQRQYPMYKSNLAYLTLGVPEWVTVMSYELAYGLDFITVELLFRGFFVIGMIKILGRHAIVPMAVIYCMLHFGKPAGEAISSIFGGYILGVIAYRTKSVWGGIIVHMGIAWLMEIIAYLTKHY
jgi:Type II CAAX prenyl endopeptidase Rce1-like